MAKQLKQDIDRLRLSADVRPRSSRASPPLPGRGHEPAAHSAGIPAPVSSAPSCLILPEAEEYSGSEANAHAVMKPRVIQPDVHAAAQLLCMWEWLCVQQALRLSQDHATVSGTNGSRRSTADSPVMPQSSPSHHTDMDASPAGESGPPHTDCHVPEQLNDLMSTAGLSSDFCSSKEQRRDAPL